MWIRLRKQGDAFKVAVLTAGYINMIDAFLNNGAFQEFRQFYAALHCFVQLFVEKVGQLRPLNNPMDEVWLSLKWL